jgi:hypothetical protein
MIALAMGLAGGLLAQPLLSGADSSSDLRSVLVPVSPARLLDTRPNSATVDGLFQGVGRLGPGQALKLGVAGRGGVPANATAVVMNITAIDPTAATFLTLWPFGQPQPLASSLNPTPGQPPTPNLVTIGLGGGAVNIYNLSGSVDIVADVTGYFTAADYGPKPGPLGLIGWGRVDGDTVTDQYMSTGATITASLNPVFPHPSVVRFPGFGPAGQRFGAQLTPVQTNFPQGTYCGVLDQRTDGADLLVTVVCFTAPANPTQVSFEILVMA